MDEKVPKRGFAALDPETRRRVAAMGGRALHEQGKAHALTRAEARRGGRKGGRVVAEDKAHMREIGRRGGLATQQLNSSAAAPRKARAKPSGPKGSDGVSQA